MGTGTFLFIWGFQAIVGHPNWKGMDIDAKQPWYRKLQHRWGLSSVGQVLVVLLVFALTGTTIAQLHGPFAHWVGITADSPTWLRWGFAILIILPLYQVVLLIYGFLLGQFAFFWNFEKRMLKHMAFWRRKKTPAADSTVATVDQANG